MTESKTQQLRSINNISRQIMNLKTELVTDPSNPLKNNDLKRQIIDRITNPQTLSDVAFAEEEMINYFHNIS